MTIRRISDYFEPLVKSVLLPIEPGEAFLVFTRDIAKWWPRNKGHSVFGDESRTCGIEPFAGGEIFEESISGQRAVWGTVRRWEPGRVVEFSWHPGRDEETAQAVVVTFAAEAGGTRITLEHRDWEKLGTAAESTRARYAPGWQSVLGELVRFSTGAASR
jgi:hypothetical protein